VPAEAYVTFSGFTFAYSPRFPAPTA
jgi:hypothetical protein